MPKADQDPWPYPGQDDTERARHVARVLLSLVPEPEAAMMVNSAARHGQHWLAEHRVDPWWQPSWWRLILLRLAAWRMW